MELNFIEDNYQAKITDPKKYKKYYAASGYDHPSWPVIPSDDPFGIDIKDWGLIPSWTKNSQDAKTFSDNNLNARAETVFEKPSFRHIIRKQRCIVPISGFFESRHIGKDKIPYYIFPKDGACFSVAGIYDTWINEVGEPVHTYTILTCDSNPLLSKIHNSKLRMPLILPKVSEKVYLDSSISDEMLKSLFIPYDESLMDARTVSKLIHSPKKDLVNVPEVLSSVEYPELAFYD
ncbi:MAG: response-associated peptidase [Bacteroidetes bacterium]|nr:response-associated peptidase [Bacteroidota bacterium]